MSEAGFFKVSPESDDDSVMCFCCFQEITDWEVDDDPIKEHQRLSPECQYVKFVADKGFNKLKMVDMIHVNEDRYIALIDKVYNEKIDKLKGLLGDTLKELGKF